MKTNNHPAHGPVSLERLHQISEILSKASAQSDGGNIGYAMADAVKVIDEVIAAFGAEPVAWTTGRYSQNIGCNFGEKVPDEAPSIMSIYWDIDTFRAHTDCDAKALRWLEEAIKNTGAKPLYTAPPAPVSVPDDEQCKPHPVMAVKGELGFIDRLEKIIEERDEDIDIGQLGCSNYDALMLAALDAFRASLPAPVVPEYPETLPCPVLLEPGIRFGKGVKTRLVLEAIQRRAEHYAELEAMTPEQRAEHDAGIEAIKAMLPKPAQPDIEMLASALTNAPLAPSDRQGRPRAPVVPEECKEAPAYVKALTKEGAYIYGFNACRAAMLQAGNSPVTPDGWIPVSERMPDNGGVTNGAKVIHIRRLKSDPGVNLLS